MAVTMASAGSNVIGSSSTMSRPVRASEPRRIVALANAGAVGEEDHVELAALGGLGAAHIMLDVQRAVGRHVGMAPGGRVIAMAADRQTEPHLACRHHSRLLSRPLDPEEA